MEYHTLIPRGTGRTGVIVFSPGGRDVEPGVRSAAKALNVKGSIDAVEGKGEFIGDGGDNPTRERAVTEYRRIIDGWLADRPVQKAEWEGLASDWGETLERLTKSLPDWASVFKAGFDPDRPRAPAGSPNGGQRADDGVETYQRVKLRGGGNWIQCRCSPSSN